MEKMYCPHCGEENNKKDKKCRKCLNRLHIKDHRWLEFFFGEAKGEIEGNIVSYIQIFFQKYFYGVVVVLSVVVSGTLIATFKPEPVASYEVVTKPQEFQTMALEDYLVGCWKITDGITPYLFENTRIVRYDFSFDLSQNGIMDMVVEDPNDYEGLDYLVIEVPEDASFPRIVTTRGNNAFDWQLRNRSTTFERVSCENFPDNGQTYYVLNQEEWKRAV